MFDMRGISPLYILNTRKMRIFLIVSKKNNVAHRTINLQFFCRDYVDFSVFERLRDSAPVEY
jgi:hypothetical protein